MNFNNNIFSVHVSTDKLIDQAININDIIQEDTTDRIKFDLLAGISFLEYGNYEKAIHHFDHIIDDSPRNYYARLARGLAYMLTERLVHALTDFDLILESNNNDPRTLYYRGYVYLLAGCYEEALEDFNNISPLEDTDTAYYIDLYKCICYYNLRSLGIALSCITAFINDKEDGSELYLIRGFIYMELCKYEYCISDMDHVLLFDAGNEDALYAKFVAHRIMGLSAEANDDITILLENKLYYFKDNEINVEFFDMFEPSMDEIYILN